MCISSSESSSSPPRGDVQGLSLTHVGDLALLLIREVTTATHHLHFLFPHSLKDLVCSEVCPPQGPGSSGQLTPHPSSRGGSGKTAWSGHGIPLVLGPSEAGEPVWLHSQGRFFLFPLPLPSASPIPPLPLPLPLLFSGFTLPLPPGRLHTEAGGSISTP